MAGVTGLMRNFMSVLVLCRDYPNRTCMSLFRRQTNVVAWQNAHLVLDRSLTLLDIIMKSLIMCCQSNSYSRYLRCGEQVPILRYKSLWLLKPAVAVA